MGVFSDDTKEVTCIYNSSSNRDVQTLGYLKALDKKILDIDISKETLTGTQWLELAERLQQPLEALIDFEAIEGTHSSFDTNACISILRENAKALNGAVVFTKGKAFQVKNPSKIQQMLYVDTIT